MLKIDEVFEGLKCCSEGECTKCPYDDGTIPFCTGSLSNDALKLIALVSILLNEEHDNGFNEGYEAADNEVVKCKDCKYYDKFDGVFPWCSKWGNGSLTYSEGFCFLAERSVNNA